MKNTVVSGCINGLLVTFGAYMAVATQLGPEASFSSISDITWSIIAVTGIVAGLKDAQASRTQPDALV